MRKLENKIALVTGAATGIGRATAIALAKEGAKVMVTDINETEGLETVNRIKKEGGQAKFFQLDVSKKEQVDAAVMEIFTTEGALDLAVNNAGIGGVPSALHEIKLEDWKRMMDINLTGVFLCLQAELKCMLQKGSGRIVNVASLAGLNGIPGGSSYSAAKHGVIGLTKSVAAEYGSLNIRTNAVCPGFIQTPILDNVPQSILDHSTKFRVPMKRIGQPEEVAKAIVWLLSEDSTYVNGHHLLIDGGFSAA
ncbi:MAG: NAD(P)-dependent dehydrogenase (short-subunit alcohol dehydrogenase family) [Granulosicoccus sp.]|jgi:NAD(P)-dependent dehydrogenase (short-subunit alcohol dehydrogenase family)